MKTFESIKPDWTWGTWEGNRELDRILDRQLTSRQKLEWLEQAETLSVRLRENRESHSSEKVSLRSSAG